MKLTTTIRPRRDTKATRPENKPVIAELVADPNFSLSLQTEIVEASREATSDTPRAPTQ